MAFDWTTNALANTPWRIQIVADIVPILIRRAKEGRPISYGELAAALHDEFGHEPKARKTLYGPPVGAVGEVLRDLGKKWGEVIPPINTIVVEAGSGLPAAGADELAHFFFESSGAHMEQDRDAYMRAAQQAVFDYGNRWDRVAQALGAPTLPPAGGVIDQGEPIELPTIPRAFGGESPEHKALKAWILDHPEELAEWGEFDADQGRPEHCISSGDRLDAYFDNGRRRLAVEVKASHASDDELMRGVYQCIKYRAVLRAEQRALRHAPNGDAVLVSARAPGKKVRVLLKRLLVGFVLAPKEAEA
jgi:hypothetical protein